MNEFAELLDKQRHFFESRITQKADFRIRSLNGLYDGIKKSEAEINAALKSDLNKAEQESYNTEIGPSLHEIRFLKRHLKDWIRPSRVGGMTFSFPSSGSIYSEPRGIVLIFAPWNYPFWLSIIPLAGAIAAGNCVIVKPSELAPQTSAVTKKLIAEIFPPEYVTVIEGDASISKELLSLIFDYIFFTGSTAVGKVIADAAAKNLTPCTLELGGKSPCIIDKDVNLKLATKRLLWGKMITSGQTCVAPDYVYVHRSMKQSLVDEMKKVLSSFYPQGALNNADYPHIVNERHYNRIKNLMGSGGRIIIGGKSDESLRSIEPTVIDQVGWNDVIMQEEIFGPLLPVLEYDDIGEVVEMVNAQPKPLSLYIFSNNRKTQQRLVREISFGGCLINDTIEHLGNPYLPFGGVGSSGYGAYHGKYSFDTFTHYKGVMKKATWFDMSFRYPPYRKRSLKIAKRFLR